MILRRDGLMTSVNILRLNLPNYCYYIKGKNNKRIGEIRISAAPLGTSSGYIELSYTDYSSRDKATREYNSLLRNAL